MEGIYWTNPDDHNRLHHLATEAVAKVGHLIPGDIPTIEVSSRRTKYRLGTFKASPNRIIIYSYHLDRYSDVGVTDVVLHELAHLAQWLANGYVSHDAIWREWAITLGARPRATGSDGERIAWAASRNKA